MFQDFNELIIDENNSNFLGNNDYLSLIQSQYYDLNQNNSLNIDEQFENLTQIPSYYLIESEIVKTIIQKGTKTTAYKTSPINKQYDEPKLYTLSDILAILRKESDTNINLKALTNLELGNDNLDELQLTKIKRRRSCLDYDYDYNDNFGTANNDNDKTKKKKGRKTDNPKKLITHDKMTSDNIIKKVKASIINQYILSFLNNLINDKSLNVNNVKLLKLDYKSVIDKLQKEQELEFINTPLKDIFSKDISCKYNIRKLGKNYNKNIIENILNNSKADKNKTDENKTTEKKFNEKDENKNDKTLLFAFEMTLREWLDIFTLKKTVKDIVNEHKDININNIDFSKIEKSFDGIDNLLNDIKKKNNEFYLKCFIICLYNYERWFYLKIERNNSKKEKEM